ncbi:hypothetical protein F5Y19DRAFT_489352 [Xylariaceae sp. FL1651]|nr:hypothetical protein F5Y19DRAFT_489352 [Xylariaceae sp. FL1651]
MDFHHTLDYHGDIEINLNACLITFSTIFYGCRIYSRAFMTKTLGLDDAIATAAYLLLVTQSALDIRAVSFGSGTHLRLVPKPSLVIQTLIYFIAVALVRFAILAFLPRLTADRKVRLVSFTVGFMIVAQTVTAFLYRVTECTPILDIFKPPRTPGLQCVGPIAHNRMMVGHATVGIAIDLALLLLPIWVIYTNMMWSKRTFQIILVLSIGFFVIITGVVRLILMVTLNFASDITYQMTILGVWTDLEGHIGLWCGCFPALQPVLRLVLSSLGTLAMLSSTDSNILYQPDQRPCSLGWIRESKVGLFSKGSGSNTLDSESQRGIILQEFLKDDARELSHIS